MLAVQSNMVRQVQIRLNIFLLMIYLTILFMYQTIQIWCHNMRIFNCSRRKGEPPWHNLGNYQRNELRTLIKNLKKDSWSLNEHSHSQHPPYNVHSTASFRNKEVTNYFNPLNPELNPICYLLALLAHCFLHVSRIRVKLLTLRLLMSYIYIYMTLVA